MQRLMPKLQSSFYRIASAGLVKKSAVEWQSTARFGTGTAGKNGTPNAKASIQLLPDRFRWIGEIKAPLNGNVLCRFGTGTAGSYATPNAKASIQLLPDRFR